MVLVVDDCCDEVYDQIRVNQAYRLTNFRIVPCKREFDKCSKGFQVKIMKVNFFVIFCTK